MRLVLIAGEPGVGKTRLSTHLALEVHEEGAAVLYGRCDEELGVPYQPWVEALSHLVMEAPRTIVDAHASGELALLVPALRDRAATRQSDPETERYMMYAAVAGLLEGAARQEPLLLILDDLHWGDAPTLSLLRYVIASGSSMRVLVVGTYRDSDLSHDHPLGALLAALHREQGVVRMKLAGLDAQEVQALVEAAAGHELDESGRSLAGEITRETDGNPFFVGEVLRHLTESGAVAQQDGRWRLTADLADLGLPQSVREVIGQRVERLDPNARRVLSAAAVIGRDFDLDLLRAVVPDLPEGRLLDVLDQAVTASLVQESRDRAGRFTFTHALVEHALHEDLGVTRCALLHTRIAEALEEQCGDDPGERLGEIAGHWAAALVSADTGKAKYYARLAAERALVQLAPDEAARWYRRALELHDHAPGGGHSERCELLIGLGEAQRQVGDPGFRQTLLDAAAVAQELGDTDRLCRAVLANNRGFVSKTGAVDSERLRALEAAAEALPRADARRARVLALLACELHHAGEPERCQALAAEAIEIARAAGDAGALAHALQGAFQAVFVPESLPERQRIMDELVELTRHLDDSRLTFQAALGNIAIGMEAGDRPRVERALEAMRAMAASVPEPTLVWRGLVFESGWAFVQGDLEAAEKLALEGFAAGKACGQPDAVVMFGGLMFNIRDQQGRLGELVEGLVRLAGKPNSLAVLRADAALALVVSDHADEARELALAENFHSVPRDVMRQLTMFIWADVCARLALVDRAGELYELLEPLSGGLVSTANTLSGSVDCALGRLATTLERYEQAEHHFAAATEIEEGLGTPLFLARTHIGWARTLIARGRPEDLDRVQSMLTQAENVAERLAADGIAREAGECRTAIAATSR